jgi:Protein of unknown function (DUF3761)
MKNKLIITLIASALFAMACGGPAANSNNANTMKPANTMSNTMSNAPANTMSNAASNTTAANTMAANTTAANKTPANTKAANVKTDKDTAAANKPAKPKKGDTFLCKDGTYSDSKTSQGACSGHGGIDKPVK